MGEGSAACRWTYFEKRNFMGIELDVLVGHPEHDLLFVATQVAKASGLQDPKSAINDFRTLRGITQPGFSLRTLVGDSPTSLPKDHLNRALRRTTIMFTESEVYTLLMRGRAPASEPFRKWVTEEVLPTIRKTGSYNAEQSTNPIAMGLMDELKALRGASVREKQGARWVLALENSRIDAAV